MWYVHLLQLSNQDIYVGSTGGLRERASLHQKGEVRATKAHRPVVSRSYVAVDSECRARQLELYFKSGSGKAIAMKRFL